MIDQMYSIELHLNKANLAGTKFVVLQMRMRSPFWQFLPRHH